MQPKKKDLWKNLRNTSKMSNSVPSSKQSTLRKAKPTIVDWRSNFPEETEEASHQHAAGNEPFSYNQKRRFSMKDIVMVLKKLWLPLFAAVLVGLAIGLTLLMVVFHTPGEHATPASISSTDSQPSHESIKSVDLSLTFYGIQAGVFSNLSGAKTMQQNLSAQGIQSFILNRSDHRVILAVGQSSSEAKKAAAYYRQKQIEVYSEKFDVSSSKQNSFSKNDRSILSIANQLIGVISAAGFNSEPKTLSSSDQKVLGKLQKQILGLKKSKSNTIESVYNAVLKDLKSILSSDSPQQNTGISSSQPFLQVLQAYTNAIQN